MDELEFEILPDSESYDRERFPYPQGVRFRRNGQTHTSKSGLDHIGVELSRGRIADVDDVAPDFVCLRMRNAGGSLEKGDEVVIYAAYGDALMPVGWFSIRVVSGLN